MGIILQIYIIIYSKDQKSIRKQKLSQHEFIAIVECTIDEAKELIDMEYIKAYKHTYLIEKSRKIYIIHKAQRYENIKRN